MATRSQAREAVIGLLYAYDSGNYEIRKMAVEILEEKKIRNKQQVFALELFDGIITRLEDLDAQIAKYLKDWDFKKLGGMERAILRLGAYEILHSQTDRPVVINEAVELAKSYGEEMAPKLVNGILDSLGK
ncbi:transcription antitermination factor NusB [Helicobacter sp. faydin-H20]|uniref:transcription antitermination factor NusB n=1 Tax=Helicobacter anatolicus TaxID=2905874 RepID=UPI001E2BBC72|nr:transcription antitermination factor NusB [Helicobacter anatolicus]MCE3037208.1 transcription antitermination factor NusB [Helicobacter anatolicus]